MKKSTSEKGFTLIEILIAILIFSIGVLGSMATLTMGIKTNIDNNARAIALQAASTALEPVYLAVLNGGTALKTALNTFDANGDGVFDDLRVTGNNGRDTFAITINEALDDNDVNVLISAPPYQSPIRLSVNVIYTGLSGIKTTTGHFTYVIQ